MKGLRSVLIFGVDVKTPKDEVGSSAMLESGPCIQAIKLLKSHLPQLLIAADVCLCPYSNTGPGIHAPLGCPTAGSVFFLFSMSDIPVKVIALSLQRKVTWITSHR